MKPQAYGRFGLAVLSLAAGLLAACGTAGSANGKSTSNQCVTFAGAEDSGQKNSLDPANQPSSQNSIMVAAVYNRLMGLDDNFKVRPELATSWESNADATQWTFHLRQSVKFSDGHPFTSADVVYTFQRLIDPATGSEAAATLSFLTKDSITAPDPSTVVFKTAQPMATLPNLITTKSTYIVENGATKDTLRTHGVGTGPFIAQDFQPVQQVHKFVKNPNYWEPGLPKAACIEAYVIQEATTLNAALQSGQIDVAQSVAYVSIPTLQQDSSIKLLKTSASTSMTIAMDVTQAPFTDSRVRTALKKVVDRQKMVSTVLLGQGAVGDDNPIPPTSPYAWRSQVPAQDIAGAKQLLAQAGYGPSNPLKLDLYTAEFLPGAVNMAQLYAQMAAQAGVQVNVITGPAGEYWDNVYEKHPFFMSGWSARGPLEAMNLEYRSTANDNESHWKNPDFDHLLDQASATVDVNQRTLLFQHAEQMITEDGGEIIPVFTFTVAAERTNCSGYQPAVQFIQIDLSHVSCN